MRNTNWIAFLKFALIGFGIILLINCRKEEIPSDEVNDNTKIELRSSNPADSSLWDTLSYDRALDIFNDMKANASGAWWQEFIENHGVIDWHLAMLSYSEGQDRYIASIPTQKNDTFSGLFLVRANSGQFDYKFVSAEDFNVSTDQFFTEHTEPYGAMAIVNGAMFNRVLESNPDCNIEDHLADSTFISLMESIELRGWCLMEIILWEVDIPEVQRPTANKYVKLGQTIYLLQWGGGYTEIRKGISFTQEELDHNAQVDAWLAYIKRRKKATIQGQYNSEGYTVFRLWTWCGDDFDQNPWDYDWTTNTNEGGGGGTNTGTNWDYTSKRWYEEDNDCLSYFSISEGEERIKELEAKLIEESCGQAAAYMIKHNIDRIMNEKCDDQLHISGLPFPGNQINVNEMMDQILTEMNNHPYVILGRKICDICDDKANDFLKQQCYEEFLECSSAPDYEECVEDKLCMREIQKEIDNMMENAVFPCTDENPYTILMRASLDLCPSSSGDPIGDFYDAIDEDWIRDDSLRDPRLRCIYGKMWDNPGDEIWCNSITNFLGDDVDLNLFIDDYTIAATAQVTPYSHLGYIELTMNKNQLEDYCEATVVAIFLHEAIHAEMWRQILDPTIDPNDVELVWGAYEDHISQHDNMANEYIQSIVDALKSRFGTQYTDLQYQAMAWRGLGDVDGEGVNTSAWNALSELKKKRT